MSTRPSSNVDEATTNTKKIDKFIRRCSMWCPFITPNEQLEPSCLVSSDGEQYDDCKS